ncbi:CooT family nickel-binding protein [Chloroflexota bacterium]
MAKAYVGGKDEQKLLLEEIASLKVEDGKLLVTTLFGEQKEIEASISEIDFMTSSIVMKM